MKTKMVMVWVATILPPAMFRGRASKKRYYAKATGLFRIIELRNFEVMPKPTSLIESVSCKIYTKPRQSQ